MYLFLLVCLFLLLSNSPCFYLFLYITLEAGDSCDADGIISSEQQQQHHSTETVYRGSKGIFHRKQQNPRPANKTNWIDVFTVTHCGGSVEERERILHRFRSLNTNKESKNEANGMLPIIINTTITINRLPSLSSRELFSSPGEHS